MANRLTVVIAGQTFHLVADESVEYMKQIAQAADEKVTEACKAAGGSTFAAGVLATLNIADGAVKSARALDALREQYAALERGCLETQEQLDALSAEVAKLRTENEHLRRGRRKKK